MWSKIKYMTIQKAVNQMNRFRTPTADWGTVESFYTQINLKYILAAISQNLPTNHSLRVIDGGCGLGEIAIELASIGHEVTGIDIHQPSLDTANINSRKADVSLNLINGDLLKVLKSLDSTTYHIGICIGVLYTCPHYKEILNEFCRIIKPNGLFIASFRTKFYFITTLLLQKQYSKALYVAENEEGLLKIAKIPTYYNWQTLQDITKLYAENDLALITSVPIGMFSGTGDDGMAAIADAAKIPTNILETVLHTLETKEIEDYRGLGRFILAVGQK